jgi:hypothetical protein
MHNLSRLCENPAWLECRSFCKTFEITVRVCVLGLSESRCARLQSHRHLTNPLKVNSLNLQVLGGRIEVVPVGWTETGVT